MSQVEIVKSVIDYSSLSKRMLDTFNKRNHGWSSFFYSYYSKHINPKKDIADDIAKEFNIQSDKISFDKKLQGAEKSCFPYSVEIMAEIYAELPMKKLFLLYFTPYEDGQLFELKYGDVENSEWDMVKYKKWERAMFFTRLIKSIHIKKISPEADVLFVWISKPAFISVIEQIKSKVENSMNSKDEFGPLFYKELISNELIVADDPFFYETENIITECPKDIDFSKVVQQFEEKIFLDEEKDELIFRVWKVL